MADPTFAVAHVIQTALTPVFLLSGIGILLGVFNARLARVSDHMTHAHELLRAGVDGDEQVRLRAHLRRLAHRTSMLDAAVAFGAIGGVATCGAALALFVGSVSRSGLDAWLIGLFAVALACTVSSLAAFLGDSLLALHGLRREGPLPRAFRALRREHA